MFEAGRFQIAKPNINSFKVTVTEGHRQWCHSTGATRGVYPPTGVHSPPQDGRMGSPIFDYNEPDTRPSYRFQLIVVFAIVFFLCIGARFAMPYLQ